MAIVGTGGLMVRAQQSRAEPAQVRLVLERGSVGASSWELRLTRTGSEMCLALALDGSEPVLACGFDIPGTTEVGFGAGLQPGRERFFILGLTSPRVRSIVAESIGGDTEADTKKLPAKFRDGQGLRYFMIERAPVDDVDALVGLGRKGAVVQRLTLPKPESGSPVRED